MKVLLVLLLFANYLTWYRVRVYNIEEVGFNSYSHRRCMVGITDIYPERNMA